LNPFDSPAPVFPNAGPAVQFEADLERVADSLATVLLVGESGSGKSFAARRLHMAGQRRVGPLVEVQLAALSASLVEAELFGHEEGAFTGAGKARVGRFQRAHGGTLVLDGVEDLEHDLQVKLLRVLQEREVEPLGGLPQAIDVRVVATTSADLLERVEEGRFRQDLYYRLAVVVLHVPALRSRLADIPAFVDAFAEPVALRTRAPRREFSKDARERLLEYSWPGNLRELENAIERVTVLGSQNSGPVSREELNFLREDTGGESRRLALRALSSGLTVGELELAMIVEAVTAQQGNLSAAARQVGISRRAVEYRLRRSQEAGLEGEEGDG
jgi:DNA-binding NtrC family response regulator